jgi:hypothetical protein
LSRQVRLNSSTSFRLSTYSGSCLMWSLWDRDKLITLTSYFYTVIYNNLVNGTFEIWSH